ncbi:MAG: M17 family peptidase N-terminal domain-containing protein [Myxococcota bacterium]
MNPSAAMELHFVEPELSRLDTLESEVIACTLWRDQRPCDGVAGLCDWRLNGTISGLLRTGFATGRQGEVVMVPGRPRLTFDKVLIFGAGPLGGFDDMRFRSVMRLMLDTIADLRSRIAVVQLPGRQNDLIRPERAADMLLETVARDARRRDDVWTLVEPKAARRRIQQQMVEERRRIRFD